MMIMACIVNVVNMTAVYNNRDFIQHDVSSSGADEML
jgi:hypothetical protein